MHEGDEGQGVKLILPVASCYGNQDKVRENADHLTHSKINTGKILNRTASESSEQLFTI